MPAAESVIHSDPEVFGGTPVFVGTRVPAETLVDYLKAGESIDRFLEDFPTVTREQAEAFLQEAKHTRVSDAVLMGDWAWDADEAGHLQFRVRSNE